MMIVYMYIPQIPIICGTVEHADQSRCLSWSGIWCLGIGYSGNIDFMFVYVEVLRPSQPNGVMSSAVSLPNHMFTGQA